MKIIIDNPPLFDLIDKKFNIANKPVIFSWGDNTIYNPKGIFISPELIAHEQIHCQRQGADPENWWYEYLKNDPYRLNEEVLAHREEYRVICNTYKDRNVRTKILFGIANRLSGPLYGNLISHSEAMKLIKQ